jgi:hypothetical protein
VPELQGKMTERRFDPYTGKPTDYQRYDVHTGEARDLFESDPDSELLEMDSPNKRWRACIGLSVLFVFAMGGTGLALFLITKPRHASAPHHTPSEGGSCGDGSFSCCDVRFCAIIM